MSIAGQFYGKSVIIMGGVGTLLITDWNPDLRLPLIQYYRDRDGERSLSPEPDSSALCATIATINEWGSSLRLYAKTFSQMFRLTRRAALPAELRQRLFGIWSTQEIDGDRRELALKEDWLNES